MVMGLAVTDKRSAGVPNKRLASRDGIPEQTPGANPMEPLGKDHFAASGNAVGKATESAIDTIMKVVKSPEVSIAAIITVGAVVGSAAIGLIVGGPKGAVNLAKLGATMGGGVGLFGAGIAMANDKNLNTYHKTLAVPMLLSVGAGLAIGTAYRFSGEGPTQNGINFVVQGLQGGSATGVFFSAVATAIKGITDVVSTFGKRLGAN